MDDGRSSFVNPFLSKPQTAACENVEKNVEEEQQQNIYFQNPFLDDKINTNDSIQDASVVLKFQQKLESKIFEKDIDLKEKDGSQSKQFSEEPESKEINPLPIISIWEQQNKPSNNPLFVFKEDQQENPFLKPSLMTSTLPGKSDESQQVNPFLTRPSLVTSAMSEKSDGKAVSKNAIQLWNISKKYYAREFLLSFYSQFGTVINIQLKSQLNLKTAVVKFVSYEIAEKAMREGTVFEDGEPPVEITWHSLPRVPDQVNKITNVNLRSMGQRVTKRERQSLDDFKILLREYAKSLSQTCCSTSREKYELLDKLDKKIREGLHRNSREYKALVGTCLEMCPEKERYFRDDKCQCSFFERWEDEQFDSETVLNPLRAVKEYSRSSADQEVPLPHELRHITALKLTIDYLIGDVMDEDCAKVTEWFDFLWNRTRAIRKDITQQNLTCSTSIDCVEKCARFHIFCSHYMCEQDMHIFDAKINLENLTKCLQTLKHMYEDYWRDHKTMCPNEEEFRGYQILLNLNNGDMLREVMSFSDSVRRSTPVKFALEVFTAVQENNYSRFFKLLKKSTFLNACLMHPYFTQIRGMALKRMSRAFTVPKSETPFPIQQLQEIFVFDDMEITAEFCNHYGFETDNFDVALNRISYTIPDENFPLRRSEIIESKCNTSMAEVINGGVLPVLPKYCPVSSFSPGGYYIGNYQELEGIPDDLNVETPQPRTEEEEKDDPDYEVDVDEANETEEEGEEVKIIDQHLDYVDGGKADVVDGAQQERPVMILREDITNFSFRLVDELLRDVTNETFDDFLRELMNLLEGVESLGNIIIAEFCLDEMNTLARETSEEVELEKHRNREELVEQVYRSFSEETVKDEVLNICHSVHMQAKYEQDRMSVLQQCKPLQEDILMATLTELVEEIAFDVRDSAYTEKKSSLITQKEVVERNKLQRYFKRWIKSYKYHMFVKSTLEDFPQSAPNTTMQDAILRLNLREGDGPAQHLEICADVSWLDNERNFKKQLDAFYKKHDEIRTEMQSPIALKELFSKVFLSPQVKRKHSKHRFWRMKILVPDCGNEREDEYQNKISPVLLAKKFSNKTINVREKFKEGKDCVVFRDYVTHNDSFFHSSVKCMFSSTPVKNCLLTTSCLAFITYIPHDAPEKQQHWRDEHKRLYTVLSPNRHSANKIVLLVIAISYEGSDCTTKDICERLFLDTLRMENVIRNYHCVVLNENVRTMQDITNADQKLEEAMEMVMDDCTLRSERIISKQLSSVVEDGLTQLFFNTFHKYCLHCKKLELPIPNPVDVVTLFNNSLDEIANLIFNVSLNSNEDAHDEELHDTQAYDRRLKKLCDLVLQLKLPDFQEDYSKSDEVNCSAYIQRLGGSDSTALLYRVNTVLQQYTSKNGEVEIFPWADVLELFVVHVLSVMYNDCNSGEESFHSHVHYQDNIWEFASVENTLLQHINSFNTSLRNLNETGGRVQLKRRKYEREYKLRDSIETTSEELSSIEDSMRQRKTRRLSQQESSPLQDIINESLSLFDEINVAKKSRFTDRLSFSPIEKSARRRRRVMRNSSEYSNPSTDEYVHASISLEDSVVDYLKQIDDANLDWRRRKEYWKEVIENE